MRLDKRPIARVRAVAEELAGAGFIVLGNQPHLVGHGGAHTFLIVWGIIMIVSADLQIADKNDLCR